MARWRGNLWNTGWRMRKAYFPWPHLLKSNKGRASTRAAWSPRVRQHGLVLAAFSQDAALRRCLHSFPVSIISRAQWGAAPAKSREEQKGPAQRAVIHHTALPKCSGLSGCTDLLLSIQRSHMNDRNFDDIGYKWVAPTLWFHSERSFICPPGFNSFWNFKDETGLNPKKKKK